MYYFLHLLPKSGRFPQQRMTERKQGEKIECEARRKTPLLNQSELMIDRGGEGINYQSRVYEKAKGHLRPQETRDY